MSYRFNAPPLQIPDGRYAAPEDMAAFGDTLRKFVRQQEALLPEIASTPRFNQIVEFLGELESCYNEQLEIFNNVASTRH